MIEIKHLSKTFGENTDHPNHVLHDIDLTIEDGDVFGIIGASGAGKSTLVRCINLLERPTSGQIIIDGEDITDYRGKKLLDLRASIGMIFQNFSLFQQRSVLENVVFPLELRGVKKEEREERAHELLGMVGLADKAAFYPVQLSGGQQQRVAIARALANNPKIMLCDEATSALDTRTTVGVLELLQDINRRLGVTLVMITHSLAVAQKVCNRISVIDAGRIVEQGATADIFNNPKHPVTRELLLNDNLVSASAAAYAAVDAAASAAANSDVEGADAGRGTDATSAAGTSVWKDVTPKAATKMVSAFGTSSIARDETKGDE